MWCGQLQCMGKKRARRPGSWVPPGRVTGTSPSTWTHLLIGKAVEFRHLFNKRDLRSSPGGSVLKARDLEVERWSLLWE